MAPARPVAPLYMMLLTMALWRAAGLIAQPASGRHNLVAAGAGGCPCTDPALCRPISVQHEREVFGFAVNRGARYDR